ncbi:MAG: hypothetical protein U9O63_02200, partial [Actinomycetota bacterium]|nr:hypothetical protein [Actinomycetota bacterium]
MQELGLDDLRDMAGKVEVETEGLQKTKLITAILESEKFAPTMIPEAPETGDGAAEGQRPARSDNGSSGGQRDGQRDGQQDSGGSGRRRRRRRGRGQQEPIDESQLETREGILDILPEGYGFLRCTGYLPGDDDAYVSVNVVRKAKLRKGDIVSGPVRPARAQEKFPALVRAVTVNGIDAEAAMDRRKFSQLTPLFPDMRLRLEVDGESKDIMARIIDLIA